jgi:hypothetical protein
VHILQFGLHIHWWQQAAPFMWFYSSSQKINDRLVYYSSANLYSASEYDLCGTLSLLANKTGRGSTQSIEAKAYSPVRVCSRLTLPLFMAPPKPLLPVFM